MKRLDLTGTTWKLSRLGTEETWSNATVPGCVHLDLLAHGAIPDPYYRDNEASLQWIGETDWSYERTFDVDAATLACTHQRLRCEGLDTLAELELNGQPLASVDNMYRTWEFDVAGRLLPRANRLRIVFRSPLPYVRQKQSEHYLMHRGSRVRPKSLDGGNWVRKEPCNFGWDWGPHLLTAGIWRPLAIIAWDHARVADFSVRQRHEAGRVALDLTVAAETNAAGLQARWRVTGPDGTCIYESNTNFSGQESCASLTVDRPALWWPCGLGSQPLYTVSVELVHPSAGPLDSAARRIGLRQLDLVRERDQWGESFRFRCNGRDFFTKGANWIPADTFDARVSDALLRDLLEGAAAANMNMIRVWGGGLYERDSFYDICDELGLCVWQDFMFACAAYPAHDPAFMASVRAEATDNVRRLRHHACLTLWCGNNEIEQMPIVLGDTPGGMPFPEYTALFDKLLPEILNELDPGRPYWPSSEHSPHGPRFGKPASQDPRWGDAHLWAVWHGREPFEWYLGSFHRFCSEFGFQSFPEPKTVLTYTAPLDRNLSSWVMEQHQRSPSGNSSIVHYLIEWFRLPVGWENTVWLSQILQLLAIQTAVEHWRRNMPRCMGALYWQLNDCWPVASWSSIDSLGRWKALHYAARRFFAPVLISAVVDREKKSVGVFLTSDAEHEKAATIAVLLTDTAGKELRRESHPTQLPANGSAQRLTVDVAPELAQMSERRLLLWLEVADETGVLSRQLILFTRPKHLDIEPPALTWKAKPTAKGLTVEITAARPALWVQFNHPDSDLRWDDSFFHLNAGETRRIEGRLAPGSGPCDPTRLSAQSLIDTWIEI